MELFIILTIPLITAIVPLFLKNVKRIETINLLSNEVVLLFSISFIIRLTTANQSFMNFFYADLLSGFFIVLIAVVNFAVSLYSIGYINDDIRENVITPGNSRLYFTLCNLFTFSMFFACVVNNLGIVWIAIEMTTLISAFLVGFYNKQQSVEGAWKYLIICSVGIAIALFGTILLYYTVSINGNIKSLNWTDIMSVAQNLDPAILKISFLLILIGYGTKAGLAPMHTWLPDAHSQSPSPISALLSGVLLKTAVYVIIRFLLVMNKAGQISHANNFLLFFGILSLGISCFFIIVQRDIKRLLAYHSIEHIGIITIGLGIGSSLGYYGALLHVVNHAATKALMFFGAGNIVRKYKTHDMHSIRGVLRSMPFTGVLILMGAFALAGSPPFSIFISEITIIISGFEKRLYLVSIIAILFITVIFGAIVHHFGKMIFGEKPDNMPVTRETPENKAAFIFLFVIILSLGLFIPAFLDRILNPIIDMFIKGV